MRASHLAIAIVAAMIVLTGCKRPEEPPAAAPAEPQVAEPAEPVAAPSVPEGFQHDPAFDASGYFMTQTPVQAGNYKLRHIAIGAPSDFAQWEAGGRTVFGPILFHFDDVTSPKQTNELGGEAHTVSTRVLPQSYRFTPGDVTFRGVDPKLGEVVFSGSFDEAAFTAARQNGGSDGAPVLMGSLQVGGERIRNISFSYWVGD